MNKSFSDSLFCGIIKGELEIKKEGDIMEQTNLQKARQKRGLSQKKLAELSGVSVRTVECYEQRARPIDGARLNILCELANALDCKISDILESEELINKYNATK
jgi:transcriptional regulator with XRE-family HTH domain